MGVNVDTPRSAGVFGLSGVGAERLTALVNKYVKERLEKISG